MDKDNYEYMCELPDIAEEMGVKKQELSDMCKELKKDDKSHKKMQKDIEHK